MFADVGEKCDVECEDLSCREVGRLEERVCWESGGEVVGDDGVYGAGGLEGVTYDNIGAVGQAD